MIGATVSVLMIWVVTGVLVSEQRTTGVVMLIEKVAVVIKYVWNFSFGHLSFKFNTIAVI